jgi:hypothetical protein
MLINNNCISKIIYFNFIAYVYCIGMLQVRTSALSLCAYFSITWAQCIPCSPSNQCLFWVGGYRRFDWMYCLHLHGPLKMKAVCSVENDLTTLQCIRRILMSTRSTPRPITAGWGFPLHLRSRMRVLPTCNRCSTVGDPPACSQWVLTGASECCKELWGMQHCWWPYWQWPRSGVRTGSPSPPASSQVSYFNKYLKFSLPVIVCGVV